MDKINFGHAPDPVWTFIQQMGAGISILGIIFLILVLCFWRFGKEGPFAKMKWKMRKALNIGLFFFPITTVLIGFTVAMEGQAKVELCASCHEAMGPYVENMINPENKSLAARHYKNLHINKDQCYECHAGYGLRGNFQAKMNGLRHTWKYYFGTYDKDIMMKGDFPNSNCLDCHGRTAVYINSGRHNKLSKSLASGKTLCVESGCHEYAHEEPI